MNLSKIIRSIDFQDVFDGIPIGIMITDKLGNIHYYNEEQSKIDDLEPSFVLGKNVNYIYGPTFSGSYIMQCLETRRPLTVRNKIYRTINGKMINSSHWVYPIIEKDIIGVSVCPAAAQHAYSRHTDLHFRGQFFSKRNLSFDQLIASTPQTKEIIRIAKLASNSPSSILLSGETGTGKDMIATCIYNFSKWKKGKYIAINCSAIPATLIEGLLFGTTKGAFTGAMEKPGLFEQANNGVLFLDEIDSMPIELQPKLLRVLQDKRARRIGSSSEYDLNLKVISSIGSTPANTLKLQRIRKDLYYRLSVVTLFIPPLRKRTDEIEDFVTLFMSKHNTALHKKIHDVEKEVIDLFVNYSWPGNIRELEHVMEGAMNIAEAESTISLEMLPQTFLDAVCLEQRQFSGPEPDIPFMAETDESRSISSPAPDIKSLMEDKEKKEKALIKNVLKMTYGNVSASAQNIGITRQSLYHKMKKFGISRNDFRH